MRVLTNDVGYDQSVHMDIPMRYALNSGERSERDLRDELKTQSKTAEGLPAVDGQEER